MCATSSKQHQGNRPRRRAVGDWRADRIGHRLLGDHHPFGARTGLEGGQWSNRLRQIHRGVDRQAVSVRDTNASPAFAGLFSAWRLGWVSAPSSAVGTGEFCRGIRQITNMSRVIDWTLGLCCANYRMAMALAPTTGRIVECNRADDRCKNNFYLLLVGHIRIVMYFLWVLRDE